VVERRGSSETLVGFWKVFSDALMSPSASTGLQRSHYAP
jgi:hypothetical protein